jgi:O-antigen/teichoic acid export membrane protein
MNGSDGNIAPDFVRRTCSLGGTQAVALLSTFLIHMLAARTLTASDYGSFALCWLLSTGCQVLLVGGIPYALRRAVSVDPPTRRLIRRYVLLGQLPISLAVALALAAGARPLAEFVGEPELVLALALLGGEILFHTGLVDPCLQILNGARADRLYTALAVGYHLARLVLTASFLQAPGGITGGMLGLLLAAGLGAAFALPTLWLFPTHGRPSRRAREARGVAAWMKTGYAHELFNFLTGAVNLWLVQLCVEERQFVGLYSVCTMLSRAALALAAVLVGASFAPLACAFRDGNRHQARVIIRTGVQAAVLLLLPAGAIIFCYGDRLLGLLCGSAYRNSGGLLLVLLAGFSLLTLCSFLAEVLGAAGRLGLRLAVAAGLAEVVTVVSTAFLFLLGPRATAWALPLAGCVGVLVLGYAVCYLVGPCVPWATCARSAVAAGLLAGGLSVLGEPVTLTALAGALLAGAAAYLAALGLLGEFRKTNWAANAGPLSSTEFVKE